MAILLKWLSLARTPKPERGAYLLHARIQRFNRADNRLVVVTGAYKQAVGVIAARWVRAAADTYLACLG